MKKTISVLLAIMLAVVALTISCTKESPKSEIALAQVAKPAEEPKKPGYYVENVFPYLHVDGHKNEEEMLATVLFEYELLDRVKYQVAYLACTCRGPEVNYWSVAYVEMSKEDGRVLNISWGEDNTGHYTAGMYGDSTVTNEGAPAWNLLQNWVNVELLNKPQEYVQGLEAIHGDFSDRTDAWLASQGSAAAGTDAESGASFEADTNRAVDDYTGATVTPNNVTRMLKGLMTYHNEHYM